MPPTSAAPPTAPHTARATTPLPAAPVTGAPTPSARRATSPPLPLQGPGRRSWEGPLQAPGTPLQDVVFVVVDLETTGGSPQTCAITEIGAVKVRGGELLGELQTFVHPGTPVPAPITTLTGITDAMVATAPAVDAVLPAFWEFVGAGAVLVAHNAPFDTGFLRAACERSGRSWPGHEVLCTVALARAVVDRDEVGNHRLATLAAHLGARTRPTHRALDDARATVDVLHALLERLGRPTAARPGAQPLPAVTTLEALRDRVRPDGPARSERPARSDGPTHLDGRAGAGEAEALEAPAAESERAAVPRPPDTPELP